MISAQLLRWLSKNKCCLEEAFCVDILKDRVMAFHGEMENSEEYLSGKDKHEENCHLSHNYIQSLQTDKKYLH